MSNPSPERKARFSAAINAFLMQRCQDKRDKLPPVTPGTRRCLPNMRRQSGWKTLPAG